VPGAPFFPCGGGQHTLRLNFSNATPEKIREGIERLGRVFREA
jgi:2-aminoadipate transaminase